MKRDNSKPGLSFRWSYVALPVALLAASALLGAVFYARLPDSLAYLFTADGSPSRFLGKAPVILIGILAQLLLALFALGLTWGITLLSRLYSASAENVKRIPAVLQLMGNMIGLPQIILGFALLDIFIYNSFGMHVMPVWGFALIAMAAGLIILGIFFVRLMRQAWLENDKVNKE